VTWSPLKREGPNWMGPNYENRLYLAAIGYLDNCSNRSLRMIDFVFEMVFKARVEPE